MSAAPGAARRWLAFTPSLLLSFGLAGWAIQWGVARASLPDPIVLLEGGVRTERQLGKAESTTDGRRRVFLLGDSLVLDMSRRPRSIPDQLADLLEAERPARYYLRSVASPAFGVFSHYFLVDRVLAARPDVVVISVNLRWFSPTWGGVDPPPIAGWLPARRWPEALALPVAAVGRSLDELAFYRALVAGGALLPWYRLQRDQQWVRAGWGALAERLQLLFGMPEGRAYLQSHGWHAMNLRVKDGRRTRQDAMNVYAPVFAGLDPELPPLRALRALVSHLRDGGVAVILYIAPLNVEHLERLRVYDAAGAARAVARVHDIAEGLGAGFVDLHALLPDSAFADHNDHLQVDGPIDGASRVARRLLPLVLERSPPALDSP